MLCVATFVLQQQHQQQAQHAVSELVDLACLLALLIDSKAAAAAAPAPSSRRPHQPSRSSYIFRARLPSTPSLTSDPHTPPPSHRPQPNSFYTLHYRLADGFLCGTSTVSINQRPQSIRASSPRGTRAANYITTSSPPPRYSPPPSSWQPDDLTPSSPRPAKATASRHQPHSQSPSNLSNPQQQQHQQQLHPRRCRRRLHHCPRPARAVTSVDGPRFIPQESILPPSQLSLNPSLRQPLQCGTEAMVWSRPRSRQTSATALLLMGPHR